MRHPQDAELKEYCKLKGLIQSGNKKDRQLRLALYGHPVPAAGSIVVKKVVKTPTVSFGDKVLFFDRDHPYPATVIEKLPGQSEPFRIRFGDGVVFGFDPEEDDWMPDDGSYESDESDDSDESGQDGPPTPAPKCNPKSKLGSSPLKPSKPGFQQQGKVTALKNGFGFIGREGCGDLFFPINEVSNPHMLSVGVKVRWEGQGSNGKGIYAKGVYVVSNTQQSADMPMKEIALNPEEVSMPSTVAPAPIYPQLVLSPSIRIRSIRLIYMPP